MPLFFNNHGAAMHPDAFLVGQRLVLRPIRGMDVKYFVKWMNNPGTRKYLLRRFPLTIQQEKEWVEKKSQLSGHPVEIVFVIEIRGHVDGNKPIGVIGLHNINWIDRNAITSTVVGAENFRNRGYGTEAKLLLLKYAFDTLGLHKISSRAYAKNVTSRKYSEKCGYIEEAVLKEEMFRNGTFEDVVVLACFRETWLLQWEKYQKKIEEYKKGNWRSGEKLF